MEADITIIFCYLYFNLKNKIILITLNNSQELNGYINGYYYENLDAQDKKKQCGILLKLKNM